MFVLVKDCIVTWTDEVTNQKRYNIIEDCENVKELNRRMKEYNKKYKVEVREVTKQLTPTNWG